MSRVQTDTQPEFYGSAPPGSTLGLYDISEDPQVYIGGVVVDTSGIWSVPVGLNVGEHYINGPSLLLFE